MATMTTGERLVELVADESGDDSVNYQTPLVSIMDSLELANLVISLEDEFGIDMPERTEFSTVGDIANYLEAQGCQ